MKKIILLCLPIFAAAPALARELPPKSLVCDRQISLRQAMKRASALPMDCRFTRILLKTERLSCENDICQVRLLPLSGEPSVVYTLRRYQP